jgi:hypothetical protein
MVVALSSTVLATWKNSGNWTAQLSPSRSPKNSSGRNPEE